MKLKSSNVFFIMFILLSMNYFAQSASQKVKESEQFVHSLQQMANKKQSHMFPHPQLQRVRRQADTDSNSTYYPIDYDYQKEYFGGPVCELIEIRHSEEAFEDLNNCVIVNGFVQLIFLNDHNPSGKVKKLKYTFPKLRVITDYLLVYRVYGLETLNQLFPNLVMIGGNNLFYQKYSLVIFENPDLVDIGLNSLKYIRKGSVRIQNNGNLCYVNTIDWKLLGTVGIKDENTEIQKPDIRDNQESCIDQCSNTIGDCYLTSDGREISRCWKFRLCQKKPCPKSCPHSCNETSNGTTCNCHNQCLGGCSSAHNASSCFACYNYYHDGTCVDSCPAGTLLADTWQCISEELCDDYRMFRHNGSCLSVCPTGFKKKEQGNSSFCVPCQGQCTKVCIEERYEVTNVLSLHKVHRCTHITGTLIISVGGGSNIVEKLNESLSELQQVGALVVKRSIPLVSLSFLGKLRYITGEAKYLQKNGDVGYSVYVVDNLNLKELWDFNGVNGVPNLTIGGGRAFFHFNPHLCLDKIRKLSKLIVGEESIDISETTNGDRVACNVEVLNVTELRVVALGGVKVKIRWINPNIGDYRNLIGYQVYFKKSPPGVNATYSRGISTCDESWTIVDVDKGKESDPDIVTFTDTFVYQLAPYTRYAFYVTTSTISTATTGALSKIYYIETPPSELSPPRDVLVRALNDTTMAIKWQEPMLPNGRITYYIIRWKKEVETQIQLVYEMDMCSRVSVVTQNQPSQPPVSPNIPDQSTDKCNCDQRPVTKPKKSDQHVIESQKFEDFLIDNLVIGTFESDWDVDFQIREDKALDQEKLAEDSITERRRRSLNSTNNISVEVSNNTTFDDNEEDNSTYVDEWHSINVTDSNYTLVGLDHFTRYAFQIVACNDGGYCSVPSIASRKTRKASGVDIIKPGSLVYREKSTVRFLNWTAPSDPNGAIEYYLMEIKDINTEKKLNHCCSAMDFNKNKYCLLPSGIIRGEHRVRILPSSMAALGDWSEYLAFSVTFSDPSSAGPHIYIMVVIVFLILAGTVLFMICWKRRIENSKKHQIYASVNPEYSSIGLYEPDEYEIPVDNIELLREIGHGHFGKVYEGLAKEVVKGQIETKVAVKTLHGNDTLSKRMEFLKEASVMKAFNSHHVVRLLGVVSITNKPMVVMEFMEHGDLKSFLRSTRPDAESLDEHSKRNYYVVLNFRELYSYGLEKKHEPLTLQQKLQMCGEIADGMAYLSETKFVHRDLAARNCLVNIDMTVKIGDFGLTRDVYETDYYRIDSRGILPVRWMAPESLKDGVFDSRSDAWSYGIVLWEIATLAEQPYQGLQHDQVTRFVIDGGYMEQPKDCPQKIYDLMLMCWHYSPSMRPTFLEIVSSLSPDLSDKFKELSYFNERKESAQERPRESEDEELLSGSLKTNDSDMHSSLLTTSTAVEVHEESEETAPYSDMLPTGDNDTDLGYRPINGLHRPDGVTHQPDKANGKDTSPRYVREPTKHRKSSTIC